MRYNHARATDDWILLELERTTNGKRPSSGEYLADLDAADAADTEVLDVLEALGKLKAAGCPPDLTRGNPIVQHHRHKCRGDHKMTTYYVLKCKPGGWRLYFHVPDPSRRTIVFLHAVYKQQDQRDPADWDRCCTLAAGYAAGKYRHVPVELAPG